MNSPNGSGVAEVPEAKAGGPDPALASPTEAKLRLPLMADALDSLAELSSELEHLSKSVAQWAREFRTLIMLVQTVEGNIPLEDVLTRIFDSFTGIIPFDRIGCAFLTEDGSRVEAFWARSDLGPMQIRKGYSQAMEGSSLDEIIRTQEPRIINDLDAYLAAKPGSEATRRIVAEGGRSSLTCPLIVGDGAPLGFLFFTSHKADAYQEVHQYVFRQLATQVAAVIERSREFQHLIDSNRALAAQTHALEQIAARDALTGALNRGAIDHLLTQCAAGQRDAKSTFGVVMVDIDHFKKVNDAFGHPVGDLVLKEFVKRVSGAIRPLDALGRYGGEEFLVIIQGATAAQLPAAMERLRAAIGETPFETGGQRLSVTASLGGVVASGSVSPADLIRRADKALYEAKARGRNCCALAGEPVLAPV